MKVIFWGIFKYWDTDPHAIFLKIPHPLMVRNQIDRKIYANETEMWI